LLPEKRLFLRDGFHRANPDASAAAYAFGSIDGATPVFLGNGAHGAFAVAGAAIHTLVIDFIGHFVPLVLNCILTIIHRLKFYKTSDFISNDSDKYRLVKKLLYKIMGYHQE
jgi:hypothetical protein